MYSYSYGLFCVMLLGLQHTAGSPATEYEYRLEADVCLRQHIVPAVWSDAAVHCQLEGGVLAVPTTSAIAQVMLNAMAKHKLASESVFIGATRHFSKGDVESLDGLPFANISLKLDSGELNNASAAEDCVALTGLGALANVSCARVLPYFCRKTNQSYPPENTLRNPMFQVSRCDEVGYEFEPETGSCYKFHRLAQPWQSAMAACRTEGGHLAIVNDRLESSVLGKICRRKLDSLDAIGAMSRDFCLIGFRKWDDEAWGTMYGDAPEKIRMFLPRNRGTEDCGAISEYGYITDAKCTKPYVYICEITAADPCNVRTFWAE